MNKTLGMGLTFNGLRVAVSVKFQKYPFHNSRRVVVTVGGLCVFEAMWDAAGKASALDALKAIGEEVAELVDALGKVEV
jgi:hypothetical protein